MPTCAFLASIFTKIKYFYILSQEFPFCSSQTALKPGESAGSGKSSSPTHTCAVAVLPQGKLCGPKMFTSIFHLPGTGFPSSGFPILNTWFHLPGLIFAASWTIWCQESQEGRQGAVTEWPELVKRGAIEAWDLNLWVGLRHMSSTPWAASMSLRVLG